MKPFEPCIIMENDNMMMYLSHPNRADSTRIDVTMAFNLGMDIALKRYDKISYENISIS